MRKRGAGFGVLLFAAMSVATAAVAEESAEAPLRTAADRTVDVEHLRLDLEVFLKERRIEGTARLDLIGIRPLQTLRLDAVGHEVSAIKQAPEGTDLKFVNTGEALLIELGKRLERGEKRSIVIHYQVRDPKTGLHFFAPSKERPDVPLTVWSQGEPRANHHWFPCLDHPNERQSTEMVVTVDEGNEVLSNGRLVSQERVSERDKVRFHWRQEKPHVAYLVTLVVGKFTIERNEWRDLPVLYYVPADRAGDIENTFGRTTEMLGFFTDRFGIDYPWEKYAQVVVEQFLIGGMENTSATTLTKRSLHDDRALLDSSPDWLIAHELAHQWWGDLVTCKDWSHIWLNEGFATYSEVLWTEHKLGKDEADYLLYRKGKSARTGAAKTRPIVDRRYPNEASVFDSRAYPKGAWVLHMLRRRLGDDSFFEGLRRYGTEFSYRTAETADLRQTLERFTGMSLERFFHDWTQRPGHPILEIASSYEAKDKLMRIEVKQTQDGAAFHFPLRIELTFPDDAKPVVVERSIAEKEATLFVSAPVRPRMVRVDPELTLLAEIKESKSRDWWLEQLANAPTVVERVRAAEHFGSSTTDADRELLAHALANDPFYGARIQSAAALGKSKGDASRAALILGLNDKHPKTRRACADALAQFAHDEVAAKALRVRLDEGDVSYYVEAALVKALAKASEEPPLDVMNEALATDSHNDVIRIAALTGLAESSAPEALETLVVWTKRDKSNGCRSAALASLAKYLGRNPVAEARVRQTVEMIAAYLIGEVPYIRRSAVRTLRELGRSAEPASSALAALAEQDPNQRVRSLAGKAVEQIRSDSSNGAELGRLRKELGKLRSQNNELAERLEKIEINGSAP